MTGIFLAAALAFMGWSGMTIHGIAVDLSAVKVEVGYIKDGLADVRVIIRSPTLGIDGQ